MNARIRAVWVGRTLRVSRDWKPSISNIQYPISNVQGNSPARQGRLALPLAIALASLLAACSKPSPPPPELPAGQEVSVSAAMSTNQIRIGDPVEVTLIALHRGGTTVGFPNPANGKDVVVRDAKMETETLANGLLRTVQKIRLTSLTITNHVVGENAKILLSTPQGVVTNAYPFLALEVVSALKPGEQEIRPAKGGLAH